MHGVGTIAVEEPVKVPSGAKCATSEGEKDMKGDGTILRIVLRIVTFGLSMLLETKEVKNEKTQEFLKVAKKKNSPNQN